MSDRSVVLLPASPLPDAKLPPRFLSRLLLPVLLLFSLFASALHATPIAGGGDGGGGTAGTGTGGTGTGTGAGSSTPVTQPATTPGPAYSWEGSVGDVKTGNGNKLTSIPIVSWIQEGGLPIGLTLNHNSQSSRNGELGPKWACNYDISEKPDASGNVTVYWGDGRVYTFMKSGTSGATTYFTAPAGVHDTLVEVYDAAGNDYTLTTHDKVTYSFNAYTGYAPPGTGSSGDAASGPHDENGNFTSVQRNNQVGYVTSVQDINTGRTITVGYDASNRMNLITDPLGRKWTLSYDANGNLAHIYWPVINGTTPSINLGYDANHNITSYQDLRGNISTFLYNGDNSIAWEKDNLGNQTTFQYGVDANNNPNALDTTIVDANGHKTVHTYNTAGQLASVTDALGYTEYYSYDGANNVTQRQDRRGYSWNSTYDSMGNTLTAKDPYGNTTTMTYNSGNKPLTITQPLGRSVANTYDSNDNLTQVQQKDAAGNVAATTKFTIGSYGLVSDKYDPNNHHTSYTYDANGYLNSTTTPLGHKTQWTYDALGFKTSRTDAMGRTTTYTPDAWERLTTLTYPDSTTRTYGYDPNGNLTAFNNAIVSISRSYDADNRLLADYYSGVRAVSHTYDAAGQKGLLSTTTDYLGNVHAFTYTARDQISTTGIPGQTVSYVYDPNGNQSQAYLPNGLRTDTYYIANNWRSSVYNISNTTGVVLSAYDCAYNADGQVTYTLEGHSTNPNTNNETTENFGYDGLGHLTSEVRNGTVPENISYVYDAAGNRTSQSGSYLNGTFSYDADDELTGFTYSGTSYASATFGYDANGDRIAETTGLSASGGGYGTQYGYDFDGNLTAIAVSSGTTYFKYDALDRQLGWVTSAGARLDYQLDGDAPLTETNQTTGQVNLYGNGLVSSGGEILLSDGLGAVRQTTNSSQNVQWSGTSQAYGVSLAASGGTVNHYQWGAESGYRSDGFGPTYASPLLKVGARYYDPEFGCFLSRDTDLSQAPYVYCDGDPVNCTDPSGHIHVSSQPLQKLLDDLAKLIETIIEALDKSVTAHGFIDFEGGSYTHTVTVRSPNGTTTTTTDTIKFPTYTAEGGGTVKRILQQQQHTPRRGRF